MMLTATQRQAHLEWLLEITGIPTATGREERVIAWIERWAAQRNNIRFSRDGAGNILLCVAGEGDAAHGSEQARHQPLYITAHLDHPAFVVETIHERGIIECSFRGGVYPPYFENAAIDVLDGNDAVHWGEIESLDPEAKPFKTVRVRMESAKSTDALRMCDVGRWSFRGLGATPEIADGMLHAPACDDLAAVAAALAALGALRDRNEFAHVGVLFTRAEEIGFIGAIAACREGWIPRNARLICLENSRSFPESPLGAGPIVRVGDKTSVFSPELTNQISRIMAEHVKEHPDCKWQRKLMPGGTCEATVFSTWGYASTCLCLALGNYHNMADIDGVLAGRRPALVAPEYISVDDYHGLVDMLILCAEQIDEQGASAFRPMMDALFADLGWVVARHA